MRLQESTSVARQQYGIADRSDLEPAGTAAISMPGSAVAPTSFDPSTARGVDVLQAASMPTATAITAKRTLER